MNGFDWIKDLVISEQKMEDTGVVDLSSVSPDAHLEAQTIEFLRDVKTAFIEAAATFNQFKGSGSGNLKIYGISNTRADFMLFRNGYKLIFSYKRSGEIEVYHSLMSSHFLNPSEAEQPNDSRDIIRAHWGAFGDMTWTYKNLSVRIDYLVRHYITRFVRESAK
jgi:hypothetical protein